MNILFLKFMMANPIAFLSVEHVYFYLAKGNEHQKDDTDKSILYWFKERVSVQI